MSLLIDTKRILTQNNIRPRKRLGQHFLVEEKVVKQIITAAQLSPDDVVLEIGAGLGILTTQLVSLVSKVIAIEIDPILINVLRQELAGYTNVWIIKEDILKVNWGQSLNCELDSQFTIQALTPKKRKVKVIANLPYYIVTPVILHLLKAKEKFSTLILMVQKEVGKRILATPGSKNYGALSIFVQYHTQVEEICEVSRQYFFPQPKVDSVVLKLNILESPAVSVKDEPFFFQVVRAAFAKRRKMIINALSNIGVSKDRLTRVLVEAGIDVKRRGETLSLEEFGRVSDFLTSVK